MDQYKHKYPYLSNERIQTLLDVGATEKQWEASNNNEKKNIDNALLKRQTREFRNEAANHTLQGSQSVMVIGATGAGKSATANTLLGRKRFQEGSSALSMTTQFDSDYTDFNGQKLTIVDTPGSWETQARNLQLPDAMLYLMVINLASPRFGQQELKEVRSLKGMDGRRILPMGLCFLVLTHADSALQNISLDEYLSEIKGDPLHELITKDLKGNVIAVNNSAETGYEQRCQQEAMLRGIAVAKARSLEIGWLAQFIECVLSLPSCLYTWVCTVWAFVWPFIIGFPAALCQGALKVLSFLYTCVRAMCACMLTCFLDTAKDVAGYFWEMVSSTPKRAEKMSME